MCNLKNKDNGGMLVLQEPLDESASFFHTIFAGETGYLYLAAKTPGNSHQFTQHFFQWPQQHAEAISFVQERKDSYEVYYAPALFIEPDAKKSNVAGARVFWCEFDGTVPTNLAGIPEPSLRIKSSTEGHEHWYWFLDRLIQPYDLERVNRAITYLLGADASGWDAGQILRPPGTINHKRQSPVVLIEHSGQVFSPNVFDGLPSPPPVAEAPIPDSIPSVEDVIAKYPIPVQVWHLFKQGMPEGKRSEGLMSLGYYLAELQMHDVEVFTLLLNADERWGKFKGRSDQYVRLMEIVVRARIKYPLAIKNLLQGDDLPVYGYRSLLKVEVHLEWIWETFLQRGGYTLITGPSGVGKTLFSLNAAAHFVLGKTFIERPVVKPMRIGIFSLEMGLVDIKSFMEKQAGGYTEAELDILEENLRIFPIGEPLYLNRDDEKERIERIVVQEKLDGIVIDSLGSATENDLSSEAEIKQLMAWNDHIRQELGIFTWYIHHHRKASGDNKKPNKLADVYGSMFITRNASSVLCLWDNGVLNTIECIPLKIRMAQKPDPFQMFRSKDLHYSLKVPGITVVEAVSEHEQVVEKEEPEEIKPFKDAAQL